MLGAILTLPDSLSGTRTAYLLTFTSLLLDSTTGLPLLVLPSAAPVGTPGPDAASGSGDSGAGAESAEEGDEGMADAEELESKAGEIMQDYLSLLDQVDAAWAALLSGAGWHAPRRFAQAVYDGDAPLTLDMFRGSIGHPHAQPPSAAEPPATPSAASLVDGTSQIRLRSVLQLGRERVLAWARPYGDFGGEVLGPAGDEGRETTREEAEGWEGCVLRLFDGPLAEIDAQQGPAGSNEGLPLGGLPEYDIPPCPRSDEEQDGDDGDNDDDDDDDMEEVQV